MLEAFVNKIVNLARPETVEIKDQVFSTSQLHLIPESPLVTAMSINSLVGVVDYIKSKFDGRENLLIHIESPTELRLVDALDHTNDRRVYLKSTALLPSITFNRFMDREKFQIMMQSNFVPTQDRALILNIISHLVIKDGVVELKDNSLTQEVTVKTGVALAENIEIPERVLLKPFRTFSEVEEQPASEFILRLNKDGEVAIFEADGGVWKLDAIDSIANYFKKELATEITNGNIHVLR